MIKSFKFSIFVCVSGMCLFQYAAAQSRIFFFLKKCFFFFSTKSFCYSFETVLETALNQNTFTLETLKEFPQAIYPDSPNINI